MHEGRPLPNISILLYVVQPRDATYFYWGVVQRFICLYMYTQEHVIQYSEVLANKLAHIYSTNSPHKHDQTFYSKQLQFQRHAKRVSVFIIVNLQTAAAESRLNETASSI